MTIPPPLLPITSWKRSPILALKPWQTPREILLARPRQFRDRRPGFQLADCSNLVPRISTLRVGLRLLPRPSTLRFRPRMPVSGEHPTAWPLPRASNIPQLPMRTDTATALPMAMIPLPLLVETRGSTPTWNAHSRAPAWTRQWNREPRPDQQFRLHLMYRADWQPLNGPTCGL